jgi:hypothetical protein
MKGPSRRSFVRAAFSAPLVLMSGCSALANNAYSDAKSGGELMLRLLREKYSLEFVILSELKETSSYGVRSIGGTVAPATDSAARAGAWVDSQGHLGDNYSARVFKDQAETELRAICAADVDLVSSSVVLEAPQGSVRWDRLSFSDFVRSPGVQDVVTATMATGMSEAVYAAQGWKLLNAMYAPDLPFRLLVYSGEHFLFNQNWAIGQPQNATEQIILDHIQMSRDPSTPR